MRLFRHVRLRRTLTGAVLGLALGLAPGLAAPIGAAHAGDPPRPAALNDAARADLARIEAYLNAITTLRAHFHQIGEGGDLAEGTFLMQRPSLMRFEYSPPSKMLLLATYGDLLVHDGVTRETTHYPIGSTPLVFLTRTRISFDRDVVVTRFTREADEIAVSLRMRDEGDSGELTLVFTDRPFAFHHWEVRDPQNHRTRVTLSQLELGVPLARNAFHFDDPKLTNPREN